MQKKRKAGTPEIVSQGLRLLRSPFKERPSILPRLGRKCFPQNRAVFRLMPDRLRRNRIPAPFPRSDNGRASIFRAENTVRTEIIIQALIRTAAGIVPEKIILRTERIGRILSAPSKPLRRERTERETHFLRSGFLITEIRPCGKKERTDTANISRAKSIYSEEHLPKFIAKI